MNLKVKKMKLQQREKKRVININHSSNQVLFKGETGNTEMDKPTSYQEKENVLENEEGEIASRQKEKGKINQAQQELGKTEIFKDEKRYNEVNKPTAYKEKKDVLESEEGETSTKRKEKGETNQSQQQPRFIQR